MLPYFKKSENFISDVREREKFHGVGGELTVTKDNHKDPVIDVLMEAAQELGYQVGDINGELEDEGFTPSQVLTKDLNTLHNLMVKVTLKEGSRSGTFRAFAEKHSGAGLTVLTHAHVNKVVIEGKRAVGVEVRASDVITSRDNDIFQLTRFGVVSQYFARQEVVLSAGSIGSPQILMLSGVGDSQHLQEVGVAPVHHLPAVGQNLQDHLIVSFIFDTVEPLTMDVLGSMSPSAVLSYLSGEGPMSSTGGCGGLAFIHTELSDRSRPDIQLHLISLSLATDHGLVLKPAFGVKEDYWPWFAKHSDNSSTTVAVTLSRPESRGFIKLRSSDPQVHPLIQPNYLTAQRDVDTLVAGIRTSLKLLDTDTMKRVGAQLWEVGNLSPV